MVVSYLVPIEILKDPARPYSLWLGLGANGSRREDEKDDKTPNAYEDGLRELAELGGTA